MKRFFILSAALILLLTGCSGLNAGELYCLPEAPEEYYDLQEALSGVLEEGLQYHAPASGSRREPVQLVDLDGDRVEEAVAFFRNTGDGAVKTYIFSNQDGSYAPAAVIDCSGSGVGSVDYADMDGSGDLELLISCQVSETVTQALQICRYEADSAVNLATVSCSRYELVDLDGEAGKELLCFSDNGSEPCTAGYYRMIGNEIVPEQALRLKAGYSGILEIRTGLLSDRTPGVFITSACGENQTAYDVLALQDGTLTAILPQEDILLSDTPVNGILYPRDMDGDGLPEVPCTVEMPAYGEGATAQSMVYWYGLDSASRARLKTLTYHDFDGGWYLTLPETWQDRVLAKQTDTASPAGTVRATAFYRLSEQGKPGDEILTIYALRGGIRQSYAEENGLSILRSDTETIYAVAINEAAEPWAGTLSLSQISDGFHTMASE